MRGELTVTDYGTIRPPAASYRSPLTQTGGNFYVNPGGTSLGSNLAKRHPGGNH